MHVGRRKCFTLSPLLLIVGMSVSPKQNVSIKPGMPTNIRLTPIEDRFSGAACRLHLTQGSKALIGGMDYYNENGGWHIGINGRDYRLSEARPKIANPVLASVDRKTTIRIIKLRKVWVSSDPNYPAEKHRVSIVVTIGGSTRTFPALQTCGDG